MRSCAMMLLTAMVVGFAASPSWSAKANQPSADSRFHMGGPSGWLTADSGQRYRFVSMGTSAQPHVFRIGGHDASAVKSMTWKGCCNVDVMLRDGTSEMVNVSQIKDVYVDDGATVTMSYGIDGLPVRVVAASTGAVKVMRFPNLTGIRSIRFDRPDSRQWLAATHRSGDADQRPHGIGHQHGALNDRSKGTGPSAAASSQSADSDDNAAYFASHQTQIRRDVLAQERADIAHGDRKAAAELEKAYQQALAADQQENRVEHAKPAAGPCWSTELTLAQIANGMANWQTTKAAGYAEFRNKAMAVAGTYVPATVSYIRQLLQGTSEREQHAAELFVALDRVVHSPDAPTNVKSEAARLQVEAMNHAPGCGRSP